MLATVAPAATAMATMAKRLPAGRSLMACKGCSNSTHGATFRGSNSACCLSCGRRDPQLRGEDSPRAAAPHRSPGREDDAQEVEAGLHVRLSRLLRFAVRARQEDHHLRRGSEAAARPASAARRCDIPDRGLPTGGEELNDETMAVLGAAPFVGLSERSAGQP